MFALMDKKTYQKEKEKASSFSGYTHTYDDIAQEYLDILA